MHNAKKTAVRLVAILTALLVMSVACVQTALAEPTVTKTIQVVSIGVNTLVDNQTQTDIMQLLIWVFEIALIMGVLGFILGMLVWKRGK